MTMLTLLRRAPVAPDAATCRLCDLPIAATVQDHLLAGQPGTAQSEAAICHRCGSMLRRLVALVGPELCVVLHEHRQAVDSLIGGPAVRTAAARSQAERADLSTTTTPTTTTTTTTMATPRAALEHTRRHLAEEADRLAHTEQALRAEADTLASLCTTRT